MGDQMANQCADSEGDGGSMIGVLAQGSVGAFCSLDRPFFDVSENFSAAIQSSGQAFAGFSNVFFNDVGCGGQQGAHIFDKGVFVRSGCLKLLVHVGRCFDGFDVIEVSAGLIIRRLVGRPGGLMLRWIM